VRERDYSNQTAKTMSGFGRVRRWIGWMPAAGNGLLLEATALSILVPVCFKMCGISRTQRWLRRWAAEGSSQNQLPDAEASIQRTLRVQRIARQKVGVEGTCLTRSLSLWAALSRQRVRTEIRIGFRRSGGEFEGHAWVEFEGVPINEDAKVVETYSVFAEPAAFDSRHKTARWH